MSHQSHASYSGSWEELYQIISHAQTREATEAFRPGPPWWWGWGPAPKWNPDPVPWLRFDGPPPAPPTPLPTLPPGTAGGIGGGPPDRTMAARALFLSGIAVKQIAARLPEGHALSSAANQAIADWEDEYCGTPPRPLPTLELATSLAAFASSLEAGDLQMAIQEEAGRLAQKAFGTQERHHR